MTLGRPVGALLSFVLALLPSEVLAQVTPPATAFPPDATVTAPPPSADPLPEVTPPPVDQPVVTPEPERPRVAVEAPTEERGRPARSTRVLAIVAIIATAIAGIYIYRLIRRGL